MSSSYQSQKQETIQLESNNNQAYLGHTVTEEGKYCSEIQKRIGQKYNEQLQGNPKIYNT
jgi:hypothetical protein